VRRLAALVALVVAGCGGRKTERDAGPAAIRTVPAPVPAPAPAPDTIDAPAIPLPHELSFTLLEPGTGTRAPLRYTLADAAERELAAATRVTTRTNFAGTWKDPLALPAMRDGFGISISNDVVHLRGLEAAIDDGDAAAVAQARSYMARARALLEKRRADAFVDTRGRLTRVALVGPPPADDDVIDEITQRWLAVAVPLPDEPVAVGARWRVVTALRAAGIVAKQTVTYRLAAADASTWTIDVSGERIGEYQIMATGGPTGGTTGTHGELLGLKRTMEGQVVVGRGDPLPLRGTLASETMIHVRLKTPDRVVEAVSEDKGTIELGPR
jgi:hypothetical protein